MAGLRRPSGSGPSARRPSARQGQPALGAARLEVRAGAEDAARAPEHRHPSASSASNSRKASVSARAAGRRPRCAPRAVDHDRRHRVAALHPDGHGPLPGRGSSSGIRGPPQSTAFRASRPARTEGRATMGRPSCEAWSRSRGCTTPSARRSRPSGSRAGGAGWSRGRAAGCSTWAAAPVVTCRSCRRAPSRSAYPSWPSLQRARRRVSGVPLVVGSAEALPFRDGCFETVLSGLVFCSVPDARRGLLEARRVLRRAGGPGCSSTCARPTRGRPGFKIGCSRPGRG